MQASIKKIVLALVVSGSLSASFALYAQSADTPVSKDRLETKFPSTGYNWLSNKPVVYRPGMNLSEMSRNYTTIYMPNALGFEQDKLKDFAVVVAPWKVINEIPAPSHFQAYALLDKNLMSPVNSMLDWMKTRQAGLVLNSNSEIGEIFQDLLQRQVSFDKGLHGMVIYGQNVSDDAKTAMRTLLVSDQRDEVPQLAARAVLYKEANYSNDFIKKYIDNESQSLAKKLVIPGGRAIVVSSTESSSINNFEAQVVASIAKAVSQLPNMPSTAKLNVSINPVTVFSADVKGGIPASKMAALSRPFFDKIEAAFDGMPANRWGVTLNMTQVNNKSFADEVEKSFNEVFNKGGAQNGIIINPSSSMDPAANNAKVLDGATAKPADIAKAMTAKQAFILQGASKSSSMNNLMSVKMGALSYDGENDIAKFSPAPNKDSEFIKS